MSDFYTKSFDSCYIVTGDGDFGCVIDFLNQNNAIVGVIAPSKEGCSFLIREQDIEITFLDSIYPKFSTSYKEKAPDADVSA